MLMVAAELYQAPFIPGWVDDLTRPDPYFVLPILLTGMMFVQSKLTPATQTGMQQKMLQYGMPLMFGVFSFFFPAGLTLYILTNVLLTAAHLYVVHRDARMEAKLAAEKLAHAKARGGASSEKLVPGRAGKPGGGDRPSEALGDIGDSEVMERPGGGDHDGDDARKSQGSRGKKRKKGKRKR
jgi:YidC/Oxa1 family membrane protein insertase